MTEILKDLKPLLDLGLAGLMVAGVFLFLWRPPKWVTVSVGSIVESHRSVATGMGALPKLATAVDELVRMMPKDDDIQELLIGQEALRRETEGMRDDVRALRGALDARR